jgi:hypothetical protein
LSHGIYLCNTIGLAFKIQAQLWWAQNISSRSAEIVDHINLVENKNLHYRTIAEAKTINRNIKFTLSFKTFSADRDSNSKSSFPLLS